MNQEKNEVTFKGLFLPLTTKKAIIFIFLIGFIVFANGIFNGFVGDDASQITENLNVHSLQNLPSFFLGSTFYNGGGRALFGAYYKPIMSISYALIYSLFGSQALAYHTFQIFLCIVNASILFLFLKRFLPREIAFVLSIIFLVHPINNEAAFYASAMQEALFFFFGILALFILQRYDSLRAIFISGLLLLCSLLSKETGILFLIISLVYVYLFNRKRVFLWLGFSVMELAIYLILRFHAIGLFTLHAISSPIQKLPLLTRIINIPEIFLFYLKTFIFPLDLSVSYHWLYSKITLNTFFVPLIIDLIFIGLIIFTGTMIYKKHFKYFKMYALFAVWFLLGIGFHLQIFPLDQTVADRWFYFPMVGLLGATGTTLKAFNISLRNKWTLIIAITLLVLLSTRTILRSFDWKDDLTLANHDIKVSEDSFDFENILSSVYIDMGKYDTALIHAKKSVEMFPNMVNYSSLGTVYMNLKDYENAKIAYFRALKYGDFYITYENLAVLALHYGDAKENISFIKNIALRKYPFDAKLWLCLALLEYGQGSVDQAKTDIKNAYILDQTQIVKSAYYTIMNNLPLAE
jgi:protein O-mannosyl-transferase